MTAGTSKPGLLTRILAAAGIGAMVFGGGLLLAADTATAATTPVTGVDLQWQLNDEVGGGAYYGGCNFLSAGTSGDNGSSGVWKDDSLYTASEGNVTITKAGAAGQEPTTWETKCLGADGRSVGTTPSSTTANQVNIAGGSGDVDVATGDASIRWDGSFTVVFYGGMTYWSVSDLKLELDDGAGMLTATASGYGADMNDPSRWVKLPERQVTLATFEGAADALNPTGGVLTPKYGGVEVSGNGVAQVRDADGWGSWPQDFVDFHVETGQAAYWFSSGGIADPKKTAKPVTLAFGSEPGVRLDHSRVPLGHAAGVKISAFNLGDVPGDLVLRGSDSAELPLVVGSPPATVSGGTGVGTWDVAGLPIGSHRFTAELRTASGTRPLALPGGVTIEVVPALTGQAPVVTATATATSIDAAWSWPREAGGPPSGYLVELFEGTSAQGAPVATQPAPETATALSVRSGVTASTEYTVRVTPSLAGAPGVAGTTTVKTPAAPPVDPTPTTPPTTPPSEPPTPTPAPDSGATFYWGLNAEANSAAFFGGCNFLAAGPGPVRSGATPWTQGDYRSADGNVTIVKPTGGSLQQASWATKCQDRNGGAVSTQSKGSYTESQVRITGGQVERSGASTTIRWQGSFTVAFYGGMTYWSAADPVLTIDANGNGKVTAIASGWGASMSDASKWVQLPEREITLADLTGVNANSTNFTTTPRYVGVQYTGQGASQGVQGSDESTATGQIPIEKATDPSIWGAFPSDFVDFQKETGQFSYWFTSGGARDAYKPTLPLTVSLDGTSAPTLGTYAAAPAPPALNQNQPGGTGSRAGSAAPAPPAPAAATPAGAAATTAGGGPSAAGVGAPPGIVLSETGGLQVGPITPPMLLGGGAGLLGLAAANWGVALLLRRRLGLDPDTFA